MPLDKDIEDMFMVEGKKRKMDSDLEGAMVKKRWISRSPDLVEDPHIISAPLSQAMRKRRIFEASIDEKTVFSVLEANSRPPKRARTEYSGHELISRPVAQFLPRQIIELSRAEGLQLANGVPLTKPKMPDALISHTPLEQFWLGCVAAAMRANAKDTWIVMPASQGGAIFQMSIRTGENDLKVEVNEILQNDQSDPHTEDMLIEEIDD